MSIGVVVVVEPVVVDSVVVVTSGVDDVESVEVSGSVVEVRFLNSKCLLWLIL